MSSRMNIVLASFLGVVVILAAVSRIDYSRPNYEFWPDMKDSPAWSAYAQNPNFRNGRSLQAPVAGTIARGDIPLHYEPTKEDARRAAEELLNPYALAESGEARSNEDGKQQADVRQRLIESVRRGAEAYRAFCICCHGPTGAGDGPVSIRGLASPSLLTEQARQIKDGQLFHIVTYGQDSDWPKSMPPFAAQLSHQRRWDVVNYVLDMQNKAAATVPIDSSTAPSVQNGQGPNDGSTTSPDKKGNDHVD